MRTHKRLKVQSITDAEKTVCTKLWHAQCDAHADGPDLQYERINHAVFVTGRLYNERTWSLPLPLGGGSTVQSSTDAAGEEVKDA